MTAEMRAFEIFLIIQFKTPNLINQFIMQGKYKSVKPSRGLINRYAMLVLKKFIPPIH